MFSNSLSRPLSYIPSQHFGTPLRHDEKISIVASSLNPEEIGKYSAPFWYNRSWETNYSKSDSGSIIRADNKRYEINLDVKQFTPREISVKVADENMLVIEGKHGEKNEGSDGIVSRHFVRKYIIPKGYNMDKVVSKLSTDGILTILIPKMKLEDAVQRAVPIVQTGQIFDHDDKIATNAGMAYNNEKIMTEEERVRQMVIEMHTDNDDYVKIEKGATVLGNKTNFMSIYEDMPKLEIAEPNKKISDRFNDLKIKPKTQFEKDNQIMVASMYGSLFENMYEYQVEDSMKEKRMIQEIADAMKLDRKDRQKVKENVQPSED